MTRRAPSWERRSKTAGRTSRPVRGPSSASLDSLAFRYASVLDTVESLAGAPITGVRIVGGGSQNEYLNQATADAAGKPVAAGPVEATALGNILVQAIAAGRFASLGEARRHVADNLRAREYTPRHSCDWDERVRRYRALEALYMSNQE